MAYEGHIAGVGDDIPGKPLRSAAIRTMQSRSLDELRERLPGVIAAIRDAADSELEWVNAGGTGSLTRSKDLGIATELTSGSGFYAPTLFDTYRSLDLTPAAFFCLPDRAPPTPRRRDRARRRLHRVGRARPRPPAPAVHAGRGSRSTPTRPRARSRRPLVGAAAKKLRVGDRVYMRHAKAGELCERFDSLYLVEGDSVADEVPTYRGEGLTFL